MLVSPMSLPPPPQSARWATTPAQRDAPPPAQRVGLALEPGERFLWAWSSLMVTGALGVAWPAFEAITWLLLVSLLLGSAWDGWRAGDPRALRPARWIGERAWQGAPTDVTLAFHAPRAMRIEVVDTLPPEARTLEGHLELCLRLDLPAGQRAEVAAQLRFVRLGEARFGRLAIRSHGPLGLVRRRARVPVPTSVRVLPPLLEIQREATRSLRLALQSAALRGRASAEGLEFDCLREYARGDDPRCIDWKASARTHTLRTRRYAPERLQECWVVLDGARALFGHLEEREDAPPRFQGAVRAALSLAAAALAQGDRVGLMCHGASLRAYVPPAAGPEQLMRLAQPLFDEQSRPEEFDAAAWTRRIEQDRARHAAIFLFTDVSDRESAAALLHAVQGLRGRRRVTLLCLQDPALARLREETVARGDEAWRWALEHVLAHRRAALRALRAAGADVVDLDLRDSARAVADAYLRSKRAGLPGKR